MYPPAHICKRLFELDPQVRLAWEGRKPKYQGELNPGSYALVQLWRRDHYGAPDRPKTIRELWNFRPQRFPDGSVDLVYVDRGPVFNKFGGLDPDWSNEYEVVYLANLVAFGITNHDVESGKFLTEIAKWFEPIKARMDRAKEEVQRDVHNTAEAIGKEVGRSLHRNLNRHDITLPVTTAEDARVGFEAQQAKANKRDGF